MTNILILSDKNFLGDYLLKYLSTKGYSVDVLVENKNDITNDYYSNLFIINRNDSDKLKEFLSNKNYSYIFDLSSTCKDNFNTVIDSINITNLERYIYCPSTVVYKEGNATTDENKSISLSNVLECHSSHIVEVEDAIFSLIKLKGLKATIFRPSYIYSDVDSLNRNNYFFNKEDIVVPNNTTQVQFIHIEDVVKNLECAMFNDNDMRAYYLTHPKKYSWAEVVSLIGESTNKSINSKALSAEEVVNNNFPFKVGSMDLDISNLRNNGFHSPMIFLNEGLNLK